jgi:putative pyruvate formate lyase activating enzyme
LKIPIIYNTSAYDSLESIKLLDGLVDIYLPDFKVWNQSTAKRLLKAEDYTKAAMESVKAMHDQVGDLCFTPDGIAKKGVLLRHLVMPAYQSEGQQIMEWLAGNVSKDLFVNIMEQYKPDAYVGKDKQPRRKNSLANTENVDAGKQSVRYAEINRPISKDEILTVRHAAERAGLWRFCDPPKHDGFSI